jgi:hypothetical protein
MGLVRLTARSPVLRYLRDGRCRSSCARWARARSPMPNGAGSAIDELIDWAGKELINTV